MTHRTLSAEFVSHYLLIAEQLLEEMQLQRNLPSEAMAEAIDCAHIVVRLKGPTDHAADLLQKVEQLRRDHPAGGDAPFSPRMLQLCRHKRKLDRERSDSGLMQLAHDSGAAHEDSPPGTCSPVIRNGIQAIRAQLDVGSLPNQREMRDWIERLARDLHIDLSAAANAPDSTASEDADWDWAPSLEHLIHNLGNDLYKGDEFTPAKHDLAIECYNWALSLRPDLLESLFNRSLAFTRLDMYESAYRDITRVIELNDDLGEAEYTAALIKRYMKDYDAALRHIDRASELGYPKAAEEREAILRERSARKNSTGSVNREDGIVVDWGPQSIRPECSLDDHGGDEHAKCILRAIVRAMRGGPSFDRWGVAVPRGVLMYGPPGVGKSQLALAVAGELSLPCYQVSIADVLSLWYGNSERNLKSLFAAASAHKSGAFVVFNEFDALGSIRTDLRHPNGDDCHMRFVGQLLTCMSDSLKRRDRLVIIATTNRVGNVDEAFRRAGRFEYVLKIPRPDVRALAEIWLIHLAAAQQRGSRATFYVPELSAAVLADRRSWLEQAFGAERNDPSGIVRLARLSFKKGLTGADVKENIRRVCNGRALAEDQGIDLGSIAPEDLYASVKGYVPPGEEDDVEESDHR